MAVTRLRIERLIREMTQNELSAASGLPQARISALERGISPRPDEARILCKLFAIEPEDLFAKVLNTQRSQRDVVF